LAKVSSTKTVRCVLATGIPRQIAGRTPHLHRAGPGGTRWHAYCLKSGNTFLGGNPMNLDYSAEDQAFRQTVERFIEAALPPELRHMVRNRLRLGKDDFLQWHRIVHRQGWAGVSWPKEYGGTGWTAIEQHIWQEACALAGVPI